VRVAGKMSTKPRGIQGEFPAPGHDPPRGGQAVRGRPRTGYPYAEVPDGFEVLIEDDLAARVPAAALTFIRVREAAIARSAKVGVWSAACRLAVVMTLRG